MPTKGFISATNIPFCPQVMCCDLIFIKLGYLRNKRGKQGYRNNEKEKNDKSKKKNSPKRLEMSTKWKNLRLFENENRSVLIFMDCIKINAFENYISQYTHPRNGDVQERKTQT